MKILIQVLPPAVHPLYIGWLSLGRTKHTNEERKQRKHKKTTALLLALLLMLGTMSAFAEGPDGILEAYQQPREDIRNIIILIPDGMSPGGITLARWYKSYNDNTDSFDPTVTLALDEMASGVLRTYWQTADVLGAITDSAPAGTAFATGHKTNDKHIGVAGDEEKYPLATILEGARGIGKATGIIATSNVQHATPAAFSSHYFDRSRYDILAEQQAHQGIDVLFGAGSAYLSAEDRKDKEDLVEVLKAKGYQYITTAAEMNQLALTPVWGMFAAGAMAYEMDREQLANSEPSLWSMTKKAIELLNQNEKGFFLMVEGSKVDWAAHANDPVGVVSDVLAFDAAVEVALDFAKADGSTLVMAVTDHNNGGVTLGDRETDGSYSKDPVSRFIAPLLKAKLTGEGLEAVLNEERSNIVDALDTYFGITDLTEEEIEEIRVAGKGSMNYAVGPIISRRANLGWTTGGHTGEDVTFYSYAPGNARIWGTLDNTDVAKIAAGVWGINLDKLTKQLFVNANAAFAEKGATVTVDKADEFNPVLKVEKDGKTFLIPESRDTVLLDGETVQLDSVIVQTNDTFYVPQAVIDLL